MTFVYLFVPAALVLGVVVGYFVRKISALKQGEATEGKIQAKLQEAKTKEKEFLIAARDKAISIIESAKKEEETRQQNIQKIENRLEQREGFLNRKLEEMEGKRSEYEKRVQEVRGIKEELQEIRKKQLQTLEKVAGLSRDKAKEVLLEMVEKDVQGDIVALMQKEGKEAHEKADKEAKKIIAYAIQRQAAAQTSETTTTAVTIPSDDMKGRIIGREGRNIKRIEELTGTEIIVDDTPGVIVVSGFNPVRRHVAKKTIEKLILDGRIHPGRIEEKVEEAKKEIAADIKETGEAVVYDMGVTDLDSKLVHLLGRLKYRSSYGQSVLRHSVEVATIAAALAGELKANVNVAKRAGLLHDIGKALDHEIEGTHVEIGRNVLKKFNVSEDVIHAMECHHEDVKPRTIEAVIIAAADAISSARPGARHNTYEDYVKRLQDLEAIANKFEGVEKSYAIQAGREIRIFVNPKNIDDLASMKMAKEIAGKIEEELKYPGEIKVCVIRETRVLEYAR